MQIRLLQRKGNVDEKRFLAGLNDTLLKLKGPLDVEIKLQHFSQLGWPVVEINGDDVEIFGELLTEKIGVTPYNLSRIELHGNYRGTVKSFDSDLIVDIGLEQPKAAYVKVKLSSVRAQLADGKGWLPPREIQELYSLVPETPISIRITKCQNESKLEGWLSDTQTKMFDDWINCGLDRIQVYDCLRPRLDWAMTKAKLERDVVSIDQMNLTTHSVLCKVGTDAVGLIPKLGAILRQSELRPFIPQRVKGKRGELSHGL